jgi:ubiquitin carboxyl-terminal hydrolase 34
MWNAIKDPLDTPVAFDIDGLDLAFKYFTSSTLTMRLAGITQINNQIGVLAEICVGESLPEAEAAPRHMADWLINNNIISHIFGPNLHVEVIKQSHIILNFLAMEGRITCEHMDIIWAAAQLKHCSKPVHDLLPGLVKHLAASPTLHLYSLLTKLEPKDHTEQVILFAINAIVLLISFFDLSDVVSCLGPHQGGVVERWRRAGSGSHQRGGVERRDYAAQVCHFVREQRQH